MVSEKEIFRCDEVFILAKGEEKNANGSIDDNTASVHNSCRESREFQREGTAVNNRIDAPPVTHPLSPLPGQAKSSENRTSSGVSNALYTVFRPSRGSRSPFPRGIFAVITNSTCPGAVRSSTPEAIFWLARIPALTVQQILSIVLLSRQTEQHPRRTP